jgi:RNA polymerase sigma factor for flagellar operon FliA
VEAEESQLWVSWRRQHDSHARDSLILLHAPWARLVARDVFLRVRSRSIDWGEFAQNATVGLIESIDRFEPDRGIEFRTFARHRVRGAVFNGLRQLWGQGISPAVDLARTASLAEDEGEDVLESFVSWTVGVGIGYLLDAASMPTGETDTQGPYGSLERDQKYELLRKVVGLLPEREAMVLTMHYFQHVPFVEVAGVLNVTKGRVSQLHKQGIRRLRECLRTYAEDLSC